ncbi:MAG TPA: L-dopachrome tautomerase-related protein, partial [Cyclobacteriaceae bacterium]
THPSTLTEVSKIKIEGYERSHPVHSDGIELDQKKGLLYYCALMGENVYRIPTRALLDENLSETVLGEQVELFAKTGANDGIIFDGKGNLYLSSLERNAISRVDLKGNFEEVINDTKIKWPDSFAFDSNEHLYFTTSQIHLPKEKRESYKIFKLQIKQ